MHLRIEKLIYGGDGLAHLSAETSNRGKAVFVPFVLSDEEIEASLTEEKPGFARARAQSILQPSLHRVQPGCPYFGRCGGCHYQHSSYDHQLAIKKSILLENLHRIAKLDPSCELQTHASPPWNYRNRSRLQVRTRPEFAAGYFKLASHELLPVKECPISSPLINRAIAALWKIGSAGKVADGVREIEFFVNGEDTDLLVELLCATDTHRAGVRAFAEEFCSSMPEIAGVSALRGPETTAEAFFAIGKSGLTYKTAHTAFRVSAGSFFQINRFLTDKLVDIVTADHTGELAVDLYAGVGLFSTGLACNFRHVLSVESSQTAASDLSYNLPTNAKTIRSATGQFLNSGSVRADAGDGPAQSHSETGPGRTRTGKIPQAYFHRPDLIVVDPPRSGLKDGVAHSLASAGAPRITYVSCDPATLARDLVSLLGAGYSVEQLHLVDLFPQTYHLETVVKLVK